MPEPTAAKGHNAAREIREHLDSTALGGNHPLMVVAPRDAVQKLLAERGRYRDALVKARQALSGSEGTYGSTKAQRIVVAALENRLPRGVR